MNDIKVSHRIPNIYPLLKKKFNINWDKGVVITYGDTVYCKYEITPDLVVHESTHIKQQLQMGVELWWKKYLNDPKFRLSQELEAYKNQAEYVRDNFKKEKDRDFLIEFIRQSISSYMYGNMITYKQACELI